MSEQDIHRTWVIDWWRAKLSDKYKAGQVEHGGRLWRKVLLPHIIDEAADLAVYALTESQRMAQLAELLEDARSQALFLSDEAPKSETLNDLTDTINRCYNLLVIGNEEGVEEEERNP